MGREGGIHDNFPIIEIDILLLINNNPYSSTSYVPIHLHDEYLTGEHIEKKMQWRRDMMGYGSRVTE